MNKSKTMNTLTPYVLSSISLELTIYRPSIIFLLRVCFKIKKNIQEKIPRHYMHSDVLSRFKSSTTQ